MTNFLLFFIKQVDFLRAYAETFFDETSEIPPVKKGSLTLDQQLEVILKEVQAFQMIPHLLWGLWSIKNSIDSNHLFGYWVRYKLFEMIIEIIMVVRSS